MDCIAEVRKTIQKLWKASQVDGNDTDLDNAIEAEIERNFHSYQPYIKSCVKTMDLLVFFKLFTEDQCRVLHRKVKSDPVEATRKAFDIINDLENKPYKFHHLLYALEEAEYPKIVQLLQGILIPVHDEHRKQLRNCAKDFYNRLSVDDILPYLLTKNVLNQHDVEELKSTEKYESRGSAVIQLLSALPNRNKDWYTDFWGALVESGQMELAILIESGPQNSSCETKYLIK